MTAVSPIGGPALPGAAIATASDALSALGTASAGAPSPHDAAAFSQALATHTPEAQASAVPRASDVGANIAGRVQELSSRLAAWQTPAGTTASTAPQHAAASNGPSLTTSMQEAISAMQGAYVFAIETTLASRGSTEGTKILNTLLKGQ